MGLALAEELEGYGQPGLEVVGELAMIGRDTEAERLADFVDAVDDLSFHFDLIAVRRRLHV